MNSVSGVVRFRSVHLMLALLALCALAPLQAHAAQSDVEAHPQNVQREKEVEKGQEQPELVNIFMVAEKHMAAADERAREEGREPKYERVLSFMEHHAQWENVFFTYLIVIVTWIFLAIGYKRRVRNADKLQGGIESIIEGLYNFFRDVMGPENARTFVPLVGSLFLFIFLNNIIGIVPLMKSPSATPITTFALSITVFLVVQVVGFMRNGIWGRIFHLMGSPQDATGWVFAPLLFVLEVIGEFVKPVSLALRLFGNIFGEDILLGSFAFMGMLLITAFGIKHPYFGVPLQFPFLFLALLTSIIQSLVFSLLASIYILLALPHHEEHSEEVHSVPQQ